MKVSFQGVNYYSKEDLTTALVLFCTKECIILSHRGVERVGTRRMPTPSNLHLTIAQKPKSIAKKVENYLKKVEFRIEVFNETVELWLETKKVSFLRKVIDEDSIDSLYFKKGHEAKSLQELKEIEEDFCNYVNLKGVKGKFRPMRKQFQDSLAETSHKKEYLFRNKALERFAMKHQIDIDPIDILS